MSTVFDVTSVTVNSDTSTTFSVDSVDSVTITDTMAPVTVTIDATDVVSEVNIEVPGVQGAPGVQNMYVQLANPATEDPENLWGPEEAGYIWIEVNV